MNLAVTKGAAVKKLTELARFFKEEDLGGTVVQLVLEEAKAINEKGLEAQISFLIDELGPEKAEEYLRSRHEDDWNTATDPELTPEGARCGAMSCLSSSR